MSAAAAPADRASEPAGRFVCVVGPSGAGKDTLIDLARAELSGDPRFRFVRRLITRPPGPGEDHEPIGEDVFAHGVRDGGFALSWRAHGLGYAVPASVAEDVAAGKVAVCNLSRAVVEQARSRFAAAVVLVTAPPEVLAARIRARGRETASQASGRLAREVAAPVYDLVIENVGAPEEGAEELAAFLRRMAR